MFTPKPTLNLDPTPTKLVQREHSEYEYVHNLTPKIGYDFRSPTNETSYPSNFCMHGPNQAFFDMLKSL